MANADDAAKSRTGAFAVEGAGALGAGRRVVGRAAIGGEILLTGVRRISNTTSGPRQPPRRRSAAAARRPDALRSAPRRPCARPPGAPVSTSVPAVAFTDERLPNGLRLIIAEDHLA